MCLEWPCASKALSLLCKFVFSFQYNPICGDIHSESRYRKKKKNITLLSICDLPTLHLLAECSATMEKSKGEEGRLPRYSGIYWCYTSSRIADSIQRTKVWERQQNPLARYFVQDVRLWRWNRFKNSQEKYWLKNTYHIYHPIGLNFTKDKSC